MSVARLDWISGAGRPLAGELEVPGDKSVSHRAIMLSAIAEGVSEIHGFLEGEDTRATAAIFRQLGVRIDAPSPSRRTVYGVGLYGLMAPEADLDCGNAGTGMRLLAGLLAGQDFASTLVGDASLSRRPMARVIEPLRRMGASIESAPGGLPPLRIYFSNELQGIDFELPVASAQVKSAVLLAGLYARGETRVREPHPTRDYTERMLGTFGVDIEFGPGRARLRGGQRLRCALLLRHRKTIERGRDRPGLARNVEQDRRDRPAEQRTPIDAAQHDDGRGRVHAEGQRQQDGDAVGAAQTGQHADQDAERDADQHVGQVGQGECDGKAAHQT